MIVFIKQLYKSKLIFAGLILSVLAINAQSPVSYLGINQGLSNNAVTCIYQDHDGFMWFGTYDGLNKYNGYSFHVFRNIIGDTISLLDNHIYKINSDGNNNIWVGCSKGISIYNPLHSRFFSPQFTKLHSQKPEPLSDQAVAIEKIEDKIFVGTSNNGLIVFPKGSYTGKQIECAGSENAGYNVSCITYDSSRHIVWLIVTGLGLCQYDFKTEKILLKNSTVKQGRCIYINTDGELLIGNQQGVYRLNGNAFMPDIRVPVMDVRSIVEDAKHELWIASDGNGLWSIPADGNKATPFPSGDNSLNSNVVYDLYVDKEGRKWIGTLRGGVNIVEENKSSFETISYNNGNGGTVNDFILSFCEDHKSNIWVGTDGAGLRYWDRATNSFTKYIHNSTRSSISSNFITSITQDSKNDIWISTWAGGINKLNKLNNSFKHYTCYNPAQNREEKDVWFTYEDSKKRLWASATNTGHLYTYNRATDKFELFDNSVGDFQAMVEDRAGNLWAGNYTSLFLIDPTEKKHKEFKIGYPVRCIHEDKKNNFWIGTEGGGLLLFDRETGKYERFTIKEGLPNNTILQLLEDKSGNFWLSTYFGLCRFNPSLRVSRNFTQSDGLQSNQFSFNAALTLKSGEFLFGGIKGFNIFYPEKVLDKKQIPDLFLTDLRIDNTPFEENIRYVTGYRENKISHITVPFDKAVLSLDFVALEYSGPDKIKYAYFLKGWDKGWNIVDNIRTANYSRLQEGSYTFYVKAMNTDGAWSEGKELLSIKILPPWYRTWWAYLIYIATITGIIYLYLLYYKRQERLRYEVKLALMDKEKEKELTEKKIAFFTHISHEFRTPLTLIVNPLKELFADITTEPVHKKLNMIQRNAKRLLSLVDQLLLFRKADAVDQQLHMEYFDLSEACNDVYLSFSHLAVSKKINLIFNKPGYELPLYGDKEKIEIILFNLLSNAIKYTPSGGTISLLIEETASLLNIHVKDSGYGIPVNVGNKLFDSFYQANNTEKASQTGFGIGLYVSQKLAQAHFGNLSYKSTPGNGATFTLTLPKGVTHVLNPAAMNVNNEKQTIIKELVEDLAEHITLDDKDVVRDNDSKVIDKITSGLPTMVIVDDNDELRNYIRGIFGQKFNIYEADDGVPAFELINKELPDIVISDLVMKKMDGIELCRKMKESSNLAHIPVILLTGSSSDQSKLRGIECGAEDYINKPFDKELIVARVQNILMARNRLQQYFFNVVTLKPTSYIDSDNKEFLERCIRIIDDNMDNPDFTIQVFSQQIGMSHPSLYKRIKSVSGLTVNVFIRYLRLRKAAELLINTNNTIVEVTYITGFNDMKYFREQFFKLFGMNPSEYVKRYRKPLRTKMDAKKQ